VARDTLLKPDYLQGAVVAIDPRSGGIRAMTGGRSFGQSFFNRATQARRQAGSAFKVFVYTAAIDNGRTPDEIMDDAPLRLTAGGKPYEPKNIDHQYMGPIDLYTALAKSRNVVAVRLISEVGPELVVNYARRMGITSQLQPYYSLALGACEVTLLEMTSAFAVLDNGGVRVKPRYIDKIVDRSNRVIEENLPEKEVVLSDETARTMVYMMRGVVDEGTGYSVRANGFWRPAAGKTGTTDDYADAWFVGFSPELACGVWAGYDQRRKIFPSATGGVVSAPIWARVMAASPRPTIDGFWYEETGGTPATTAPTADTSARPAPAQSSQPAPVPGQDADEVEGY
jgi:penicillin-binding protein 1A